MTLGPTIKKLRKSRKMKAVWFSSKIGISTTALAKIEKGTGNPLICTLGKVAKVLDMKVWEIVKEAEEEI